MSKKKILLVEDEQGLRDIIAETLEDKYDVTATTNGKTAREVLAIYDFDLVFTDIQMPELSGTELLEWGKQHKPNIPFVIMTGFSTILETKSAFELGAKGFLAKPFKGAEMHTLISSILQEDKPPAEKKKDSTYYCRVSIDDFVARPQIDFDVYIKLSDTNFVKIAHKNQELPKQQIIHYKTKGIKYLHILKEDFHKLVNFNLDLAKIIKSRKDISPEKKAAFLKYTGDTLLERTFIDGIDKESLQDMNVFVNLTVSTLTESKENFELLSLISTHSDQLYADSVAVSAYSVLIAKQLDFTSSSTLFKICMAGLLHDVGKKEIDKELLEKPRHLVTKDERKLIESHVVRGYEIINAMSSIPSEVARMVYEHHEDQEGLGYPMNKIKKDQHPLSRIIQCASLFLENIRLQQVDDNPMSAASAIKRMETLYESRIDTQCLKALKTIFNVN